MKIGIVTFHDAYNYGAVLQAYALQTHLIKAGHKPFIINCDWRLDGPSVKRPRKRIARMRSAFLGKVRRQILRPLFLDFQKKHLKISSYKYTGYTELKNKPPTADAYVCGSDQIWHPNHFCSRDERAIWLDFGAEDSRRVAYAPSFGVSELDSAVVARWTAYARRFHAISVREKEGVDLVRKLGRSDAVWVPDPVLLLDPIDYDPIETHSEQHKTPSIFSYQIAAEWEQFARAKAAVHEVINAPFHDCRPRSIGHNLFGGGRISPGGWISSMRHARFVITSSFHGLALSLLFHRPFIVLLRSSGHPGISRITCLLDVVGLRHRLVSPFDREQVIRLCRVEIDWPQVEDKLMRFRETGVRFLSEALS